MALLFSLEGSLELTLEFSGLAVDPLSVDSIEGLNRVSVTVQYVAKHWSGCGSWGLDGEGQCFNLYYLADKAYGGICALRICASFGSTRLICASFGSTRLICASFGSTRLICASFGSTRLICTFYGTTRLLCRVGVQRGADRREAGRMREGHMDASGFLIASAIDLSLVRKVGSLQIRSKGKKPRETAFYPRMRKLGAGHSRSRFLGTSTGSPRAKPVSFAASAFSVVFF
ncbi:hypothetical protein E6C27_scaffold19358G00010 [Cucumis melo var. makuwa]|uniref:DNA-directed RNA polymerase I subunit RPA1-like n=1 Tax=Cucumis melo var. makuwa TaxID=1194695 RepID=A0A5A7TUM9_CUCMM|nr:hypothetical protein E6C27_scaffold19358G00010 [Cucumis melo var. makuwa]